MAEPIYKTACPACGAPVGFLSSASVMAVCSYCQSTLLRAADSVRDIGKMSAVLADYSPIQIGTSGVYEDRAFSVVGRIQLQYEDGGWNEWHVLFDDGSTGWLADASGQYVFTVDAPAPADPPAFDTLQAGQYLQHADRDWIAADVRHARCVAGAGELPFQVGAGYGISAADFRSGEHFMTLDWDGDASPRCYLGRAVTLDGLKCQLLRDDSAITDSAGRLHGRIKVLACPACGSPVSYAPGLTRFIVCPACQAESRNSPELTEVLATRERLDAVDTTLALGDSATIDGLLWDVLGIMVCNSGAGTEHWTEYQLFNVTRGFLWLTESQWHWSRVQVLDVWPDDDLGVAVKLDGERYRHMERYRSTVCWVAGSFNWRVRVGDTVFVDEYARSNAALSSETSAREKVWSRSWLISDWQMSQWFGTRIGNPDAVPPTSSLFPMPQWEKLDPTRLTLAQLAQWASCIVFYLGICFAAATGSGAPVAIMLGALLLLWLPILLARRT